MSKFCSTYIRPECRCIWYCFNKVLKINDRIFYSTARLKCHQLILCWSHSLWTLEQVWFRKIFFTLFHGITLMERNNRKIKINFPWNFPAHKFLFIFSFGECTRIMICNKNDRPVVGRVWRNLKTPIASVTPCIKYLSDSACSMANSLFKNIKL